MRVTIVSDNFGPYHVARVNEAAAILPITGIELRARSQTYGWDSPDQIKFPRIQLPPVAFHGRAFRRVLTAHLESALAKSQPDAVAVNGWGDFLAPQSIRWCVRNGVPFILLSETFAKSDARFSVREIVKRRIVNLAAAALVGGSPHREYLERLGVSRDRIFVGQNVVDNKHFVDEAARWRTNAAGCSGRRYFLASNRFIDKKNLPALIRAYASCVKNSGVTDWQATAGGSQDHESANHRLRTLWDLVLLGDGDLKPQLIHLCNRQGLRIIERAPWEGPTPENGDPATVYFPGFRQIDELPRFYASADIFVHAATIEPWGLVVNEAMASGLPVLVSNRCGCAHDLVDPGVSGDVFDPSDVNELAEQMLTMASLPEDSLRSMGLAGQRIVSDWGPPRYARKLQEAAQMATEQGHCPARTADRVLLNMLCAVR